MALTTTKTYLLQWRWFAALHTHDHRVGSVVEALTRVEGDDGVIDDELHHHAVAVQTATTVRQAVARCVGIDVKQVLPDDDTKISVLCAALLWSTVVTTTCGRVRTKDA